MASYHDPYDSRPRTSRRTDSFSRSARDDAYLKPTAGPYESGSGQGYHGGERRSAGPDSYYTSSRPSNRNSYDARYDSRYSYPPRRSPSRARRRRSWPPQPCVEDEVASLRKEAGGEGLLRSAATAKDEAIVRGKIDQEPIIEDVPGLVPKDDRPFKDARPPRSRDSTSTALPTPPSSEDERHYKASRRPFKLDMSFKNEDNYVPEMGKRTSTPYSYTKPAQSAQPQTSGSYFNSPDLLSPPQMSSTSRFAPAARSQPPSPRRDSARYSPSSKRGSDYFRAGYAADESAVDDSSEYDTSDSVGSARSGRSRPTRPTTYPPSPRDRKLDEPRADPATSVVDFAPPPKNVATRRIPLDARRNTDTINTLPTNAGLSIGKTRPNVPVAASGALAAALSGSAVYSSPSSPRMPSELPLPKSRDPSYASSRNPSPSTAPDTRTLGPSPRLSAEYPRVPSSTSSPVSRDGSVSGSRPSSPSPRTQGDSPRLPRTDLDWGAVMAANAARRPKQSSRLGRSMQQQVNMPKMPELPELSRPSVGRSYSAAPPLRGESLPYPMRDGPQTPSAYMPSERMYQDQSYFSGRTDNTRSIPEKRTSLQAPHLQYETNTASRAATPAFENPPNYSSTYGYQPESRPPPQRPGILVRHSTAAIPQAEGRQDSDRPGTSGSTSSRISATTVPAKEDLQALVKKKIGMSCRRTEPRYGYDDWYKLIGAPNLDFCPDCVCDVFDKKNFDDHFKRGPRIIPDAKVQCALGGSPWIRLAFLLTLQRERRDLNLLQDIADIDRTTDACPGNQEDTGPWFGLRDSDGWYIRDFRVCYNDVRKIECLWNNLSGQLVRQPDRHSHTAFRCAMRPDTNRVWPYLDTLMTISDRAASRRQAVDQAVMLPFIDFAEKKMRSPECTRDTFLTNALWHYIPALPEMTVCAECFEHVVIPEVAACRPIAMRFNHSAQPVPYERGGSSCQLYSKRTRRIFREAVRDDDWAYLARKARERQKLEADLQEQYREIQGRMSYITDKDGRDREEWKRLERKVGWIGDEWAKME